MARRGRAPLTSDKAGRAPAARSQARRAPSAPAPALLYTAQDVARFCEVDLKTIHHWANAGKIAHHRTEGRHLRFRRNHVLAFLRRHGYPFHDELASARPTVFYALAAPPGRDAADGAATEDIAKKLSARFFVRRFDSALAAIANVVAGEPDALVVALDDPTWAGARSIRALKGETSTSWPVLVVVTSGAAAGAEEVKDAGADLVLEAAELGRLAGELARTLAAG